MNNHYEESKGLHLNYEIITEIVEKGSKVLDLGCGEGDLLKMLVEKKACSGVGVEIDQNNAVCAIEKGLSVIQGDIDEGLKDFSDNSFDYVILNQTLQLTEKPDYVIKEMLRVGKKVVVSFPNFGYWKVRLYLLFQGKMPKSNILPFEWFDTPNIHLLTIKDFFVFCKNQKIKILEQIYMNKAKKVYGFFSSVKVNLFAEEAMFVLGGYNN